MYTIGIKRRFLPGYRKVQVQTHELSDQVEGCYKLLLTMADKSYVYVSAKGFKLFPDFQGHLDHLRAVTDAEERAKAEVEAAHRRGFAEAIQVQAQARASAQVAQQPPEPNTQLAAAQAAQRFQGFQQQVPVIPIQR